MTLHPNLARSLRGRRNIILSNNRPRELPTNQSRTGRVHHSPNNPGDNQSLTENTPVTPLRQISNAATGVSSHQTRDPITPGSSSIGLQPVYQSLPAQAGHTDSSNPLPRLELPRGVGTYAPIIGQGPVTVGTDGSSALQMTPYSSAPPSNGFEYHDQQQALLPGPSSSQSGRGQLSPFTIEALSQYSFGASQQRNTTQNQLIPKVEYLHLPKWNVRVLARLDKSPYPHHSWIYRDVLPRFLRGADWENSLHPLPPRHITLTAAGYNPKGGEFIELALQNGDNQVVQLALVVVDREDTHGTEERAVDLVLCQNYFSALATQQNVAMSIEPQMGGVGYPNTGHQEPFHGQSQILINSTGNLDYSYNAPVWRSEMEGVQMDPRRLIPSFQYTVSSVGHGSSAAPISSATTPDMHCHTGGVMPYIQPPDTNMPWQQHDNKPDA